MPLGARTIPSRRSVLTCRPALPGGRFLAASAWDSCRPTRDSNGSRRACRTSLSAGAAAPGADAFLTAGLAGALAAVFLAGLAGGLAAGRGRGFVAAGAGVPWPDSADFTLLGVEGLTCASMPGAAAAIMIPSPRVIAERIVRSFPLSVYQPRRPEAWLQLREPQQCQRAW